MSTPISIQVACTATSAVLSLPTTSGVFQVGIQDGQDPTIGFPKFLTTEPNCPISYTLTPSAGNTFMDTTVLNTDIAGDNLVKLLPGRQNIKDQYKFTITATALGGATITSPEWTMDVVCGPLSFATGSLVVTTSLGTTQTVGLGTDAFFTVDSITNTFCDCQLTSLMLEDLAGSNTASTVYVDSSAPVPLSGTQYHFLKTDTSLVETTPINLKITFEGGKELLKSYTLSTSCALTTGLNIVQDASFWNPADIIIINGVNTQTSGFPAFTETMYSCPLTYELSTVNTGVTAPAGLTLPASCGA